MLALAALLLTLLLVWCLSEPKKKKNLPPGPKPWPVIGSLHLLGQHETPFQAFTALSKLYGDIFSITLGATPCVVVNNFDSIREVLITKGAEFGGRPDFMRFHKLFGGDRNNSLALCDWSSLQKTRRSIARNYCSPKFTSLQFDYVNQVGCQGTRVLLEELRSLPEGKPVALKPMVLAACMNMFTQYMCSAKFDYRDAEFKRTVRYFDEIFWEINQGYAVDFLPWLLPLYANHMQKLSDWASEIRKFILARIIEKHRATLDPSLPPKDFTDALLLHLDEDPNMNWQHIIFELEDFLGGHSAVGNLVMVALAEIVKNPQVGKKIQAEVDNVTNGERLPNLSDRTSMPYTEAVLWETLRSASSPIVPHVATAETEIGGFTVEKGTMVFINNYELNVGNVYWDKPELFSPERFISVETGTLVKPAHFIPFSTGKRTCIGQRLVQCFSFIIIATIMQYFDISSNEEINLKPCCMAVPPDCFEIVLHPRNRTGAN
ncbi:cytochrome P450 307a1-like [Agrilus planipennis]|uniref:Cytochrome P450 307a1-like n=1 Tax=Agrilus planipennis TaxID=224129 RepID=A0A1W4X2L3_AGRPL|nr:cytochrome P450 307a1-like [Agrilus planipennis]XP_025837423.1 cytochrome P450 307a1-like [Agrilus planipennis]